MAATDMPRPCSPAEPSFNDLAGVGITQKIPRTNIADLSSEDLYPLKGKYDHLEGRVLAKFEIDAQGKAASIQFLRVDAPPLMAEEACKLLRRLKFDVSHSEADAGNQTKYLLTIRYCLVSCDRMHVYPGSGDISIASRALPPMQPPPSGRFH